MELPLPGLMCNRRFLRVQNEQFSEEKRVILRYTEKEVGELGVSGPLKHFLWAGNFQCMQMNTEMVPADHLLYSLHTKHIPVCSYQIK